MKILISEIKRDDYPAIDLCMQELHTLHVEARPDIYAPLAHPYSEEEFLEIIEDGKHIAIAVKDEENCMMGFGIATLREKSGMVDGMKTAYVEDVFVHKEYRRQGIAKEIFEQLEKQAKEQGAERIDLMVWSFNEAALKLYQSLGIKPQRYIFEKKL